MLNAGWEVLAHGTVWEAFPTSADDITGAPIFRDLAGGVSVCGMASHPSTPTKAHTPGKYTGLKNYKYHDYIDLHLRYLMLSNYSCIRNIGIRDQDILDSCLCLGAAWEQDTLQRDAGA